MRGQGLQGQKPNVLTPRVLRSGDAGNEEFWEVNILSPHLGVRGARNHGEGSRTNLGRCLGGSAQIWGTAHGSEGRVAPEHRKN